MLQQALRVKNAISCSVCRCYFASQIACGFRRARASGTHIARRLVHVEAHLDELGIKLPKAIVPPQGKLWITPIIIVPCDG